MPGFRVVLIEHGYSTTRYERDVIEAAGGEFVDADAMALDEALRLCEGADGILCRRIQVPRELLQRFRRCRVIVRYGVGTDNIDVDAATDLGIIVGHVPSYCADEVSSHAIALMLASLRHVAETDRRLRAGGWDVRRGDVDAPDGRPHARDRRSRRDRSSGRPQDGRLGTAADCGRPVRRAGGVATTWASNSWTSTRCAANRTSSRCTARCCPRRVTSSTTARCR